MRKLLITPVLFFVCLGALGTEKYQPNWESLSRHEAAPEWFRDAKLGIYFHWGVYSVPAYGNEWYPCRMFIKGNPVNKHHIETYGDPAEYGYDRFVDQWKTPNFHPEEWAKLFREAGARFAGPVAEHHDGFSLWNSKVTPWNAVNKGPRRDLVGELAKAIRSEGLKFITTFHHARNHYGHFDAMKKNYPQAMSDPQVAILYGQMPDEQFHQMWLGKLKEVIDQYQPDIIWFDSWLDRIPESYRQQFCTYYLNAAEKWGKEVVIVRKQNDLPIEFTVLDHEKSRENKCSPRVWMTDDTISTGSWCYTRDLKIKPPDKVIHALIDTVAKNGVVLLNISPRADGTIPQDQQNVLRELGAWLKINGEAIYATRPWETFGEGPTIEPAGGFKDRDKFLKLKYTDKDIRYTRSKDGKTVYAIVCGWPKSGSVTLQSVLVKNAESGNVRLLGANQTLQSSINDKQQLVIKLGECKPPCKYAYAFALTGFDLAVNPVYNASRDKTPPEEKRKGRKTIDFSKPRGKLMLSKDLVLEAAEAQLTGPGLRLEKKSAESSKNIGFWNNPEGQAHWLVKIPEAGAYRIDALVATPQKSRMTLSVAGQTVTAEVPKTGSWTARKTIQFGRVHVNAPGEYELTLQPASADSWNAVNVWNLKLVAVTSAAADAQIAPGTEPWNTETKKQHDERMKWWREARFGMFVHWGLYALPAGTWKGKKIKGPSEWIMDKANIPIEEYETLAAKFNPVKYDPEEWVKIAKKAGMKYIVITSKHHDGFALFDSKVSDWDVVDRTPWGRDLLKPLADACRKHGLKFCTYYSIMDWHHPAQYRGKPDHYNPTKIHPERKTEYMQYMKAQIKELLDSCDPEVLWFDGEWPGWYTEEDGREIYSDLRKLKPQLIINNRVGKGRKGMEGLNRSDRDYVGDFGTPEQQIPSTGLPGIDWESCMTMNHSWGYKSYDHDWKSAEILIRNLIDIASKGGNYLLNVGPTAEGVIPDPSVERLESIGKWMDKNGESIYAIQASPFEKTPWGRCTQKLLENGNTRLYLHVFNWPNDGTLEVPKLKNRIVQAFLLDGRKQLKVTKVGRTVSINVPAEMPDPVATVVVLDVKGKLKTN